MTLAKLEPVEASELPAVIDEEENVIGVPDVVGAVVPDTIMFKVVLICCVPSGLSHSP